MNNPKSEPRASILNRLERSHGYGFPPGLKGMRCRTRIKLKSFTDPDGSGFSIKAIDWKQKTPADSKMNQQGLLRNKISDNYWLYHQPTLVSPDNIPVTAMTDVPSVAKETPAVPAPVRTDPTLLHAGLEPPEMSS